ncbi:hypothetical protein [Burkholderia seminalis]|uniref:hypothetical protein n=1 Tax=Burkholderia seminalis TaxID=488731 RepID=UPI00190403E2|nr:hypothetical protein [Burkholderia seminalis]MBJ9594132.1 hypothetical protein [Burkholderia seminalis]
MSTTKQPRCISRSPREHAATHALTMWQGHAAADTAARDGKATRQYRTVLDAIVMRQADSLGIPILLQMIALVGVVDETRRQDRRENAAIWHGARDPRRGQSRRARITRHSTRIATSSSRSYWLGAPIDRVGCHWLE